MDAINAVGRRKEATAKATAREGNGTVRINNLRLDTIKPEMRRLMIKEPLMIAGDVAGDLDIDVDVDGGGQMGQAEAARQAIARALVSAAGDEAAEVRKKMDDYDRHLLVSDPRRTEPHKPSRSSSGARRHKQRSKR